MERNAAAKNKRLLDKLSFLGGKGIGTLAVFVVLVVFFSAISDKFLTVNNLMNILLQVATLTIIAMGMTWVIISGGIDLSTGASIGFCGVATAMLVKNLAMPVSAAVVCCILMGGCIGFLNGLLITRVNIPALLATIGMSTAIRGLAFIICNGKTIFGLPPSFMILGRGHISFIPISVIIAIAIVVLFVFLQNRSAFSIYTYAIGNNANSAYLSGIKTKRHQHKLYVIIGLLTGLAAFINASRIGVGLASTGENMDFDVVTAVVLGGTSIAGGVGRIQGTALGCIIMGVLANGMMIMNMHSFAQQLAKGLILLLAIGAETIRQKNEL